MRRISVIGSSGSGKSTLARGLSRQLGIPHLELDAIYHLAGWQPAPRDQYHRQIRSFIAGEAWVVDGDDREVGHEIWQRADTVVFLDYDRWRVMARLLRRSLRRGLLREKLWNGNRERLRDLLSPDPERNVMRWSWQKHAAKRERFLEAHGDPRLAHLDCRWLRHPREAKALLRDVTFG